MLQTKWFPAVFLSQVPLVSGQNWMPFALPMRCRLNTGLSQQKQVSHCTGDWLSVASAICWERGYQVPLIMCTPVGHVHTRLYMCLRMCVSKWFYMAVCMCICTVMFAKCALYLYALSRFIHKWWCTSAWVCVYQCSNWGHRKLYCTTTFLNCCSSKIYLYVWLKEGNEKASPWGGGDPEYTVTLWGALLGWHTITFLSSLTCGLCSYLYIWSCVAVGL